MKCSRVQYQGTHSVVGSGHRGWPGSWSWRSRRSCRCPAEAAASPLGPTTAAAPRSCHGESRRVNEHGQRSHNTFKLFKFTNHPSDTHGLFTHPAAILCPTWLPGCDGRGDSRRASTGDLDVVLTGTWKFQIEKRSSHCGWFCM